MQTVLDRRKASRKAAAELDPRRRCRFCGVLVAYAVKDRPACRGCKPLAQAARARRLRAERKLARAAEGTRGRFPLVFGWCPTCGAPFTHVQHGPHAARFCNKTCKARGKRRSVPRVRTPQERRRDRLRRRANRYGAFVEHVDPHIVFERDDWTCHLCGGLLVRNVVAPEPLAATLDHVVALAAGGLHEYANVKAAHFLCNSLKRDLPLALALAPA